MVTDRRERRIAARMSAEYVALRPIEPPNPEPDAEAPPTSPTEVDELLSGGDDDADFAGRDDGGFYDDAFEVLT